MHIGEKIIVSVKDICVKERETTAFRLLIIVRLYETTTFFVNCLKGADNIQYLRVKFLFSLSQGKRLFSKSTLVRELRYN